MIRTMIASSSCHGCNLTRRRVTSGLAAAGLGLAGIGLPRTSQSADEDVVALVWAGYDRREFFPEYYARHGGGPHFSVFGDDEEAFQKMRAGFRPDFVQPCSYVLRRWAEAGFLGSIDTTRLRHWPELIPELRDLPGSFVDGRRVFVPTDWGLTSVIYRTDAVSEAAAQQGYGLLWDARYRGRLAMIDSQIDSVTVAALHAGLDPFKLSPADIETVRDVLQKQRPLLRMYTSDNSAIVHALASGEVVAALGWSSDYADLKAAGLPVAFMRPPQGRMTWVCGAGIHAQARHVDRAYELIDALISPEGGAFTITHNGTGASNLKSFELVPEAQLDSLGLTRDPNDMLRGGVFQTEQQNAREIGAMFEEVKLGL